MIYCKRCGRKPCVCRPGDEIDAVPITPPPKPKVKVKPTFMLRRRQHSDLIRGLSRMEAHLKKISRQFERAGTQVNDANRQFQSSIWNIIDQFSRHSETSLNTRALLEHSKSLLEAAQAPKDPAWREGMSMKDVQNQALLAALEFYQGNRSHAARALRVSKRTVRIWVSNLPRDLRAQVPEAWCGSADADRDWETDPVRPLHNARKGEKV